MGEAARKQAESERRARQIETRWVHRDLEPLLADHAHLSKLNDQYYLTFGQIRVPVRDPHEPEDETIRGEIRPVVQIVVSTQVLRNIADLLARNLEVE